MSSPADSLIDKIKAYNPGADTSVVEKAYEFAALIHRDHKRLSGDPYITHPLAVGQTFMISDCVDVSTPDLIKIISANGLKINRKKTSQRTKRSVITGIDTGNNTLRVSKEFRDKENPKLSTNQITGRKHYADRVKKANQPSSYKQ